MELVLLALLCGFLPVRSHADVMYSTLGQSILFPCERKSSQGSEPILWGFHRPGEDPPAHMTQNPGSLLTTSLSDKRSRVVVLSNSSLQLQGLQPEDAGIYTCIQRNPPTSQPLLNQVTLILLTVRILPRGPVGEGSHVLMRCSMTCDVDENRCTRNPQGAEVSWTDSHWQPIKEQAGRYSTQPGGTFSNLKVTVQQADHRRKWKCILSVNQQTQAVQEVAIPVRGSLQTLFVAEGHRLLLPCLEPSLLQPGELLEWGYREIGDPVSHLISTTPPSGPPTCARCGADLLLLPNSTLLLPSVRAADARGYHCLTHDASGSPSLVRSFRVGVLSVVADASSPPQNGSIIALTCSVVYNPNSSDVFLAWADNRGIPLTPGTAGRFQVIQANSSLQLVIQDLQPSDAEGAWRCSLTAEGEERASQQYHLRFKGLHSGVAEGPRSGATILALLLLLLLLSVQCFLHTR
ncbi:uncharacterized protein LOC115081423 isoform X1 [Rhinatrema bivittatum]|uniref:uncharacterized protein LOC115081423 isoform X1 n=1 Tax=Rhinatrema bivittatum TaxID=194408 RepID=UPI00112D6821|nr:uncharacterized protein LOC115081423 isoform X1 [Rhinatrema bivittatum]